MGLIPNYISDTDDQVVVDSSLSNNSLFRKCWILFLDFYYVQDGIFLRCVNLDGKTERWKTQLPDEYYFGSNPAFDDLLRIIYIYTSNDIGLMVAAFDMDTGRFLWEQPGDKPMVTMGTYINFTCPKFPLTKKKITILQFDPRKNPNWDNFIVPVGSPVVHPNGLLLLVAYPLYGDYSYVYAIKPAPE